VSEAIGFRWIRRREELCNVLSRLVEGDQIAVDTEADSLHSYYHKLCLIQLSCRGENLLVDPLEMGREDLAPLAAVLTDRGITKVMHGSDYDLRVLHRDLATLVQGVQDTQLAAQLLGAPQTGLAALLETRLGVAIDKRFQRADWGQRPLSDEMAVYAASDTAHLIGLRDVLRQELMSLGRLAWWEEECAVAETVRWEPQEPDALAFERVKGARRLRGEDRDRLAALFGWRERVAAAQDTPPFRVLQADPMLTLAQQPPADLPAMVELPGLGRGFARRYGEEVLRLLAAPPPAPEAIARAGRPLDRVREQRITELRAARDAVATTLGVEPGVVASRAALSAVVDRMPADRESLREVIGRRWRAAVLADAILPIVAGWRAGSVGNAEPH
jgi:ribonuclease D